MRLTPHPQGRHRPTAEPDYRPAFSYRPTTAPLVETWEQARRNYAPPTLREWMASLWAAIARRNTVDPHPDTVGRDQQGEPWKSQIGSPPKQGHASNSR